VAGHKSLHAGFGHTKKGMYCMTEGGAHRCFRFKHTHLSQQGTWNGANLGALGGDAFPTRDCFRSIDNGDIDGVLQGVLLESGATNRD
jgi:hypothetical protein